MINSYAATKQGAKLEPFTYDPGPLAGDSVEINVNYCGICHSDLSMINNDWGFSSYPLVAGHEVVGTIAAIGEHVNNLKVGQTVGLGWHSAYCNHCAPCRVGDHNLCSEAIPTILTKGGFADKVRAKENTVVQIPDGMDLSTVGPLFCGGITVFNPLSEYKLPPTSKVAVIGIGGLGHMALQFLRAWGCHVTAFSSTPEKEKGILEMGAHVVLNSKDSSVLTKAAKSFDMIISTVNVALDWKQYLACLKPRGRLHFVGAVAEPLNIGVFDLLGGQKTISSSPVGSPATITKMLEFAHLHQIKPQVEIFPMDQVNEAIEHLEQGKARYRVVLQAK